MIYTDNDVPREFAWRMRDTSLRIHASMRPTPAWIHAREDEIFRKVEAACQWMLAAGFWEE